MATDIPTVRTRADAQARSPRQSEFAFPVLDRKPGLFGRWLAALPGEGHPVWTYLCGIVLSVAAIAGLSILAGLLVTRVLLHVHGIAHDDEAFVSFLARHRSTDLTDASLVGSIMAGGVVLPIVAGVSALVAARAQTLAACRLPALRARRRVSLVPRDHARDPPAPAGRPPARAAAGERQLSVGPHGRVDRDLCGLALLLTSRLTNRSSRIAVWAVALLVPVFVAFSRMYRGMHHPLDIVGGAIVGIAALSALVLVSRAANLAATRGRE